MVFKVALAFMTLTNFFILQIVPSRVFQTVNFSSSSRDYGLMLIAYIEKLPCLNFRVPSHSFMELTFESEI